MSSDVTLELALDVSNREDGDEYSLSLYFSQQLSAPVEFHPPTYTASVTVPQGADSAYLHSWLYMNESHDDTDAALTETPLGSGYVSARELSSGQPLDVSLLDIDRGIQARLTVCAQLARSVSDRPLVRHAKYLRSLIQYTSRSYTGLDYNADLQKFTSVSSHIGELPLVCFPVLSMMYTPTTRRDSERFLIHVLQLTCQLRGVSLGGLSKLDPVETYNFLGEMVCWITRCLLYVADFTRGRSKTSGAVVRQLTDEWSVLADFPHLGKAGFDCEDGSGLVLAIIHLLKTSTTQYAPLQVMQEAARQLTFFFTLGQLYDGETASGGDKYVAHAFVIGQDADYVDQAYFEPSRPYKKRRQGQFLPSIAIESTNWTECAWSERYWASERSKQRVSVFKQADEFFNVSGDSKWKRMIKTMIPSHVIQKRQVYGDVAVMISTDHRGGDEIIEALMVSEDGSVGINIADLLLMRHTTGVRRAENRSPEERLSLSRLKEALVEMPIARLPDIPERWIQQQHTQLAQSPPGPSGTCFRFTMRTADYQANQVEVEDLFTKFQPGSTSKHHEAIYVTPDASFTMFQVLG
jgi:hypothetical protein